MKLAIITDTHFGARNDNLNFNEYFFKFYEFCRKKLIEGITGLKSKEILKSAVNLDKMFNFNYIQINGINNVIW